LSEKPLDVWIDVLPVISDFCSVFVSVVDPSVELLVRLHENAKNIEIKTAVLATLGKIHQNIT
jgi:hypothetical protein